MAIITLQQWEPNSLNTVQHEVSIPFPVLTRIKEELIFVYLQTTKT